MRNQKRELEGKVAVVTGGGGVLCSVMAEALAREGARVAVLDKSGDAAAKVAKRCGNGAIGIAADVLDRTMLEAAHREIRKRLGRVEILVNGAGGNHPKATTGPDQSFFDLDLEAFNMVFQLNMIGTVLPCQVFCRDMVVRKRGVVINIASMNAFRPLTRIAAYSAAKAAVKNFTEWLAVHMAREYSARIRVNAIAPGFFLTKQNRYLLVDEKTGQPTARGQAILEATPQRTYGEPEDLVSTLLWLCSDASRFVTGVTVPVDGGFNAFSGV
ncbi:MAG: SDR family NAD(P)-dependent oxidoreductase [bacterium]|nr:SDR family NAD(P)-dependent oxidoreductase [bacterium]